MTYQKVTLMQDDSCHWYLIPFEKVQRFLELDDMGESGEYEMEEEFDQYRLGGSPQGQPFWIQEETQ